LELNSYKAIGYFKLSSSKLLDCWSMENGEVLEHFRKMKGDKEIIFRWRSSRKVFR